VKFSYDAAADVVYIEFRPLDPATAEARPLNDDIIADYGPDGQLAGLEILDAHRVLGQVEEQLVFEVAVPRGAQTSALEERAP
jgi:uncharacterized protein YuzE